MVNRCICISIPDPKASMSLTIKPNKHDAHVTIPPETVCKGMDSDMHESGYHESCKDCYGLMKIVKVHFCAFCSMFVHVVFIFSRHVLK